MTDSWPILRWTSRLPALLEVLLNRWRDRVGAADNAACLPRLGLRV